MRRPKPFTILTVCTGNICRSPAVEYLLREALDTSVRIHSAGTGAVVGHPVEPAMAALLRMDTSEFAARQLTPSIVRESDLILALTRDHRSAAAALLPAALRRTFTLREFARLVAMPEVLDEAPVYTDSERLLQLAADSAKLRGQARVADASEDDIADPYRLPDEAFARAYAEIDEAIRTIAAAART